MAPHFLGILTYSTRQPSRTACVGTPCGTVYAFDNSLFDPADVNFMCYVDDPPAALRGTPNEKEMFATCIILVWESLNLNSA